jgi:hypothetical protein
MEADFKVASEALSRICVLGGDWNGHPVEGTREFLDWRSGDACYPTLDLFEQAVP